MLLRPVENGSGCPVVVSKDASLKTLAASRMARVFPRLFKNQRRRRVGRKNWLNQPARHIATHECNSGYTPNVTVWDSTDVIP